MFRDIFLEHHFHLEEAELTSFDTFLESFIAYNSHTNLSAIREPKDIVEKHFVDSLYASPIITEIMEEIGRPLRLLDIGSGGGFPGIPLKIVFPELSVLLLDNVGKKVKAMETFIADLHLSGIRAMKERAEILARDPNERGSYDIVVSRATAFMSDILPWSIPFLRPRGRIILYKMASPEEAKVRDILIKKLHLVLEGEIPYILSGKERVLYIFRKK